MITERIDIDTLHHFAKVGLESYRLDYLEQPVKRQNIAGLAAIHRQMNGIPLLADEGVMTLADSYAIAKAEDVFCVKLYKVGGLGPDPIVPDTDFVVKDGHVTVPHRPGLGIPVDERALASHTLKREVVK